MRVVGGAWRGRPLTAPAGRDTRPTSDKVREAIFDVLGALPEVARRVVVVAEDDPRGCGSLVSQREGALEDQAGFAPAGRVAREDRRQEVSLRDLVADRALQEHAGRRIDGVVDRPAARP